MRLVHEVVDIPLHAVIAGKALAFRRPTSKRTLRMAVPFWTHAGLVTVGDRLWAAAEALQDAAAEDRDTT